MRDLEACIDFYTTYAQMRFTHDRVSDGKRVAWLAEPGKEEDFIVVLTPGGPGREQISSTHTVYTSYTSISLIILEPSSGVSKDEAHRADYWPLRHG